MTPEQADLLRRACIVIGAYLDEGQEASLSAVATHLGDPQAIADAGVIATIAMGTVLREFWGTDLTIRQPAGLRGG